MPDLHDDFRAAAEEYTQRLRDDRERRNNPGKSSRDNADAFANYIEQQINEQRANGTRLDLNTL